MLAFVKQAMLVLRTSRTFDYAPSAMSNASINALMEKYRG
jgi:hypothetical protein